MNFVVIGKDKDAGELRAQERPAHLEFVAERQDAIVYAGPLIAGGRMIGSVFIFDLADREALDAYLAQDPYFTRPIFGSVEIYESKQMVPRARFTPRRSGAGTPWLRVTRGGRRASKALMHSLNIGASHG